MDEEGRAREILPRQSGEAEGMIEEFMLMANQAAASLAMEKRDSLYLPGARVPPARRSWKTSPAFSSCWGWTPPA